jgi:peptide/nickel transport system permease protein
MAIVESIADIETVLVRRPRGTLRAAARSPALWLLALLVLVAILAHVIAPFGPTEITTGGDFHHPSTTYLFGTDGNGMDVFSRVLYGARKDLLLSLAAVAIAAAVGVLLGSTAGYVGGWLDSLLQRLSEIVQAFPVVMLGMAVLVALGTTLLNLTLVIALVNIPVYFRIVRSVVLPLRESEFVEAARCAGNTNTSILVRHLLPNVWAPVIAQFTVNFAWAIQVIAGLSFLGLGVRVPEPEWGTMVQQGSDAVIRGIWWVSFAPGIAIFVTVLVLNRVGAWMERTWRVR